jgi:hypothetical protein
MTVKVRQRVERSHDVHLNDIPAKNEEVGQEPIRSGALVQGHALDGLPHFIHGELPIDLPQIGRGDPQVVEVKREQAVC